MHIKVAKMEDAWKLVNKLFPTNYMLDPMRSKNAGYNIYFSTKKEINAWISNLGNRLEINYPDGTTDMIWIEEESDQKGAICALITEKKVFPSVTLQHINEKMYPELYGITFKTDSEYPVVQLWTSEDQCDTYSCDEVAYIKMESLKSRFHHAEEMQIDELDFVDLVRKYLGNETADNMKKSCEEHGLI